MDTYSEQLVKIKNGARFYFGVIGIWFAVLVISFISLLYLRALSAVIIVAVIITGGNCSMTHYSLFDRIDIFSVLKKSLFELIDIL